MPLENLTGSNVFITNLVPSNPLGTDPVSEGDDHIKGTKQVLLNSFPAINGAVTATPVQLNQLAPAAGAEFTGVPTAPTAAPGTDTTQIATTAFVVEAVDTLADASLGIGQTWQDVIASRTKNTTYTNSTGKPIQVNVSVQGGSGEGGTLSASIPSPVSWVAVSVGGNGAGAAEVRAPLSAIIPDGHIYKVEGAAEIFNWTELR